MSNFNIKLSGPFMDEVTPEGLAEALREHYGLTETEVTVERV